MATNPRRWHIFSFISCQRFVTKRMFVCLKRSEAKQVKRQSLEQRKVYYRAKQGERVAHAQNTPNSLMVFREKFL